MGEVKVNSGYELYQIITDFGEPLEIFREAFQNAYDENATKVFCRVYAKKQISGEKLYIDIWNNGNGLKKEQVSNFFDLANSTKIDENIMPQKGKLGYKGHGSKIFFNATSVHICSKNDNDVWAVKLESPLNQIQEKQKLEYSDFIEPGTLNIHLPDDWKKGFMVRIIEPQQFKTKHTHFKLEHKHLRDYITWYTVFGTIKTLYDDDLRQKNINLYLAGLNVESFINEYSTIQKIDPIPNHEIVNNNMYEVIKLGHYFPPTRTEKEMKEYAANFNNEKNYYNYYSKMVYNQTVDCSDATTFRFIISAEGYETKRKYDMLLTKQGKARNESTHSDTSRYGIWACKGGIPVEKIDDWVEGGKGVYSYIQAFVDCDEFQLTANRGSIRNTDIEKIGFIKNKINDILKSKNVKKALDERQELEELEKTVRTVQEDEDNLKKRFKDIKNRKKIILAGPNKEYIELLEPSKNKTGNYSESETMVLLINILSIYPNLFTFNILDYNTTRGIDFVVENNSNPKYIELKGTLTDKINHPFSLIYKFICYDYCLKFGDEVTDNNEITAVFSQKLNDKFFSNDDRFKNKPIVGKVFEPKTSNYQSMEVICLKEILEKVIGAKFE